MRHFIILFFIILPGFIFSQDDAPSFNSKTVFNEGIYTTLSEVLSNSPKYHDCRFETKVDFWFGDKMSIFYFDTSGTRHEFNDTILFVVEEGIRYVNYKNHICKLILTGAISTFYIEKTAVYSNQSSYTETNLFFWDIQTGIMDKVNITKLDGILKRDNSIYSIYSGVSDAVKKKTLYSYILKYNAHNPIYMNN
jgi:hypothetical protein